MGLFDKIRGRNEDGDEVELKPPAQRRRRELTRNRTEQGEVELRDPSRQNRTGSKRTRSRRSTRSSARSGARETPEQDDEDGFILPGMKAVSTDEDKEGQQESQSWRNDAGGDRLEQILEQNERIIELLEDIAGHDDTDTDTSPMKESDMW